MMAENGRFILFVFDLFLCCVDFEEIRRGGAESVEEN